MISSRLRKVVRLLRNRQWRCYSTLENPVGIRMLPEELRKLLFEKSNGKSLADDKTLKKVISHLKEHNLWGRSAQENANFPALCSLGIPKLAGENLEDHFKALGSGLIQPYVELIQGFSKDSSPNLPKAWIFQAGWYRYSNDVSLPPAHVPHPLEHCIVLDVETISNFPVLACAASNKAVYLWCSQWLVSTSIDKPANEPSQEHLIPLGKDTEVSRLVIGHNVSYDRSFICEQYELRQDQTRFLDTMSLHMAVSGLTSFQRVLFNARKTGSTRKEVREMVFRDKNKGDEIIARKQLELGAEFNLLSGQRFKWMDSSTLNNLRDVHALYCPEQKPIDKEQRNIFVTGSIVDVRNDFQRLATYCFNDVAATRSVFFKLWPMFSERFPHPVTLAGMLEMGCAFLPVNQSWSHYITSSDLGFHAMESSVKSLFVRLANDAVSMINDERYKNDPWLWDLDWTISDLKLNKAKISKKASVSSNESPLSLNDLINTTARLPKRRPHLPGYPKWFAELVEQNLAVGELFGPTIISQQMRVVPKLLRLTWNGFLVHFDEKHGWGYLVPEENCDGKPPPTEEGDPYIHFPSDSALQIAKIMRLNVPSVVGSDASDVELKDAEETNNHRMELARMVLDAKGPADADFKSMDEVSGKSSKPKKFSLQIESDKSPLEGSLCPDVRIRGFKYYRIPHKDGVENRVGNPLSKSFLSKFSDGTLRANCGEDGNKIVEVGQICSYWKNNRDRIADQLVVWTQKSNELKRSGVILPRVVTAGTVTRRAVEPTWLTASNARSDRLGSELKAMVHAPDGYDFVGADVDSQELWIAAVIGDAHFAQIHGSTALGWMTLQGNKTDGTDMHSKTASTLKISRDQAKIINYGRIYGAGRQFAERLLMQFNPKLSSTEAKQRVEAMYAQTKGVIRFMPIYHEQTRTFVRKRVWHGGSESAMFNKLEDIARSPEPRTPVLGCRISRALEPSNVHGDFITSRINWVVQSSAVDYLHLMLVATRWLFETYGVRGRFSISIHDEVRYLVKHEDRFKAALALHVANLFTRAMFASKLGFNDLPSCVAFFSSVDIDKCLRKEPYYDCVTPSNRAGLKKTYGIEPGITININQTLDLLAKENEAMKNFSAQN